MKNYISVVCFITFSMIAFGQTTTSSTTIEQSLKLKATLQKNSIVKNVPFTNVGPTIMSGRVVDVDVNPNNSAEFYVAYASGGLWYTNNNGTSYTPITDNAPTQNMGDIAIDWNKGTIWIGTGESNSSRSSYAGIGILKSNDKGKTWENAGLTDSHHIGRIIINPDNPDIVIVGVIGHLYSSNKERGIFKTTDGGKTWVNVLFINDNTGIIDISPSPINTNILYAASWERDRKAWDFNGDGKHSAIYKSTDAGTTWTLLSKEGNGFPVGSGVGRIGLATFNDTTVYALLDNQFRRPKKDSDNTEGLKKEDFKTITKEGFLKLSTSQLNNYLRNNRFPRKYSAKSVKELIQNDQAKPSDLATYIENPNAVIFDTPVIGAEVYKSTDGGISWKKTHDNYLDGVYSSYGYYFGIIAVNTSNENKVYIGGVPLLKSDNGGETFSSISKENVHSDHQSIWVNPNKEGHIINGNDGGINITYDDGENWIKSNQPAVGQFYYINVDNQKPYNIYGGLQDNGVWYGPSTYTPSKSWNSNGNYPYKKIGGGDGMQVQIDNRDNNIVYGGSQFGFYYRLDLKTNNRLFINPKHQLGDFPYRYNWQAPILLSPHNQDILYMGSNKLLRSLNKGESFEAISEDLTTGGKKGNVPYGTLATISESPFQFGLIYTGSDDGYVHITKNGGANWENISNSLPKKLWVSRVIASAHKKERVYITLNGYRWDDFNPYVYMSNNYGKTWENISNGLPHEAINVIKEDPVNENLLYLGTDNGVYVSFNKGKSWEAFSNGFPNVAVHDLVIQEEAKDLVIGTHGRSIYKTNITSLQLLTSKIQNKDIHLFETNPVNFSRRWGQSFSQWRTPLTPDVKIKTYSNTGGEYTIKIISKDNITLKSIVTNLDKGLNYTPYDLSISEKGRKDFLKKNKGVVLNKASNGIYYLSKGSYSVEISGKDFLEKQILKIQ